MPTKPEKQRRKQIQQQLRAAASESFTAGLPMQPALFKRLFNYLDEKLSALGCDDKLTLTKQFANEQQVHFESLRTWLTTHGGYCDCEVLANVEEQFEGLL